MQAGALLEQLRGRHPHWEFQGVGGRCSRQAGLTLWADSTLWSIVGASEALSRLPRGIFTYLWLRKKLLDYRADLTILIDSPAIHMRLARHLKKHGLRSVYYFPPSAWTQQPARLREIHSRFDAVIPCFELNARRYQQLQLEVAYFGHPLVDLFARPSRAEALETLGLPEGRYLAMLPGSRTQEIRLLLPPFLKAAEEVWRQRPEHTWLLPVANPALGRMIEAMMPENPPWIRRVENQSRAVMAVAEAGLLSSGSATLEASLLGLPHLICYRLNRFDYWLGRLLIALGLLKVPRFGLPNLVIDADAVPEFLQHQVDPPVLARHLVALLAGPERERALADLARVRQALGPPGAVQRVSQFIERLAQGQTRSEALREL